VDIGPKLRALRENRNLTQQDVADQLYITRQTLSKWETGAREPSTQALIDLSQIYHTTLNDITGTSDNEHTTDENIFKFLNLSSNHCLTICALALICPLIIFVILIFALMFVLAPCFAWYISEIDNTNFNLFIFGKLITGVPETLFLLLTFIIGIGLLILSWHVLKLYISFLKRYFKNNLNIYKAH